MASLPNLGINVLMHSEQSGRHVSMTEIVVPAHSAGPPLHTQDFDEAFSMLEGELIFQLGGRSADLLRLRVPHPHESGTLQDVRQ